MRHQLIILDASGDTRYTWDTPDDGGVAVADAATEAELAAATAAFEAHVAKGYAAFETTTAAPTRGTVVKRLNPAAERTTLIPQFVGG